jgi:SAM-dependent methyltransferase
MDSESEPELTLTGERCVPWDPGSATLYEHFHRYWWASRLVEGLRVVDAACGEGYGSALLAKLAASVIGFDIAPEAIRHARLRYESARLCFVEGDLEHAGAVTSEPVDAIICFEAIEHVEDHEAVLRGFKELLEPDGLLLISTPDKEQYSDARDFSNPYHVHELGRAEFRDLLGSHFRYVALWEQSFLVGSVLAPETRGGLQSDAPTLVPFTRTNRGWEFASGKNGTYIVALASDKPLASTPASSILLDVHPAYFDELDARLANAYDLRRRAEEARDLLDGELRRVKIHLHAQSDHARSLEQQLSHAFSIVKAIEARNAVLEDELAKHNAALAAHIAQKQEAELAAERLEEELFRMNESAAMKLATAIIAAKQRILPLGTTRRSLCDRVTRALIGHGRIQ